MNTALRPKLQAILFFVSVLWLSWCYADVVEEFDPVYDVRKTSLGLLKRVKLKGDGIYEKHRLYLNNRLLLESRDPGGLYDIDADRVKVNNKKLWIKALYEETGKADQKPRYYVIDFSGKGVVISNAFEFNWAKFDWASWGKTNSVFVFKDGSKFIYENGKVRLTK